MVEQAGKVIEALRGSPALLAVVLLQVGTMAMIYFLASSNAERTQARELKLIETCGPE